LQEYFRQYVTRKCLSVYLPFHFIQVFLTFFVKPGFLILFTFQFQRMNIFVAKLNYDTQEDDLRAAFEEFGEVTSCNVITDKFTGKSKGFAFVEMPSDEEAHNAINALNDTDFDGRTIVVKKAEPRESRGSGGGGGRGGYGGGGNRGGGNRGGYGDSRGSGGYGGGW
jgi:RNA recognition motif-containing protein